MQARVKWVEGLTFLGESASGHQILMDGNSGDKAPSPMEMVLMAAGGCSAIDVVSILQKGRHDVTDCEVKLTSERREEAPRLFRELSRIRENLIDGENDYASLEQDARATLEQHGWRVDYVEIRQADTLELAHAGEKRLVVLAAARIGKTRLIDNVEIFR